MAKKKPTRKKRPSRKKGGGLAGSPAEHKAEVERVYEMIALSRTAVGKETECQARVHRAINFFKLVGRFDANYGDAFYAKGQRPSTGRFRYMRNQVDEAKHEVVRRIGACIKR